MRCFWRKGKRVTAKESMTLKASKWPAGGGGGGEMGERKSKRGFAGVSQLVPSFPQFPPWQPLPYNLSAYFVILPRFLILCVHPAGAVSPHSPMQTHSITYQQFTFPPPTPPPTPPSQLTPTLPNLICPTTQLWLMLLLTKRKDNCLHSPVLSSAS